MPTIPLYSPPSDPNAAHALRCPGGYECWYFDAEDPINDCRMVAVFCAGDPFQPRYARAYERYIRRPTRNVPPLPASFPGVYVGIHRGGQRVAQYMSDMPLALPLISRDGTRRLSLSCASTSIDLTFRPRWSRPSFEHNVTAEDRWVVPNSLCDVQGSIRLPGSGIAPIAFRGRGYHDHHWGTNLPASTMREWIWGRVLWDDAAVAFQVVRADAQPDQVVVVEADARGIRTQRNVRFEMLLPVWSRWGLTIADTIFMPGMTLVRPRVADQSVLHLRLVYDAIRNGKPRAKALVHILRPRRLRVPFISQTIERKMKILSW